MKLEILADFQDPSKVEIRLPNWDVGGLRERVEISIYELILLQGEIEKFMNKIQGKKGCDCESS